MSKEKDNFLVHDPLAWLKDDPSASKATSPASDWSTVSDSENTAADSEAARQEVSSLENELDLASSLQIMDVAQLKVRMLESLNSCSNITLRAAPDITIDAAGIQLLLAFAHQAQSNKVTLRWDALPVAIIEAAKLLDTPQLVQPG